MKMEQIFNKPVLVNNTFDYVGTIYKLIASGNSGEMQFALVEDKSSEKMFVLPLDKIINITEDYIVIESPQALADFEMFQEMAKGEYLILDENTSKRADIGTIIKRRVSSANTAAAGPVSYLSFMQPEAPVGVGAPYAETPETGALGALKPALSPARRPLAEAGLLMPDDKIQEDTRLRDREALITREEQRIKGEDARLRDREERVRLNEELLRNESLRQARESERIKAEAEAIKEEASRLRDTETLLAQREERIRLAEASLAERDKKYEQEAQARQKHEDIDITRLFMLQEERLKLASQLQAGKQVSTPIPEGVGSDALSELKPHSQPISKTAQNPGNTLDIDFLAGNKKIAAAAPEPMRAEYPAQASKTEPDADSIQSYINRQRGAVTGKRVKIDICDENGNILVNAGTVITDRIFDEVCAKRRDAVIELAMFSE